jgi:hypothetical protein
VAGQYADPQQARFSQFYEQFADDSKSDPKFHARKIWDRPYGRFGSNQEHDARLQCPVDTRDRSQGLSEMAPSVTLNNEPDHALAHTKAAA